MSSRRRARLDSSGTPPGARFTRAPLSGHVVRVGPAANDNGPDYRWFWLAAAALLVMAGAAFIF